MLFARYSFHICHVFEPESFTVVNILPFKRNQNKWQKVYKKVKNFFFLFYFFSLDACMLHENYGYGKDLQTKNSRYCWSCVLLIFIFLLLECSILYFLQFKSASFVHFKLSPTVLKVPLLYYIHTWSTLLSFVVPVSQSETISYCGKWLAWHHLFCGIVIGETRLIYLLNSSKTSYLSRNVPMWNFNLNWKSFSLNFFLFFKKHQTIFHHFWRIFNTKIILNI